MGKHREQRSSQEQPSKKNWFQVAMSIGMDPRRVAEYPEKEAKKLTEAMRVLHHLYNLSQVSGLWSSQGEGDPIFEWGKCADRLEEIYQATHEGARNLSNPEEQEVIAIACAFGLTSEEYGVGNIISAFDKGGRETWATRHIQNVREGKVSKSYLEGIRALGTKFCLPHLI